MAKKVVYDNDVITSETSVKLLGVTIDYKLDFSNHVTKIYKRAIKSYTRLLEQPSTLIQKN